MKISTLCFLKNDEQILLGMKKRDFGKGRWNGIGGKVEEGENIKVAAIRELQEEIGVVCREADLKQVAVLKFRSDNQKLDWDAHVFFIDTWEGEPVESDEMLPKWFLKDRLPFSEMWPDDTFWFPYLLSGKFIQGKFTLDAEGENILEHEITEVRFNE